MPPTAVRPRERHCVGPRSGTSGTAPTPPANAIRRAPRCGLRCPTRPGANCRRTTRHRRGARRTAVDGIPRPVREPRRHTAPPRRGPPGGAPPIPAQEPARLWPTDDRRGASPGRVAAATGRPGLPRRCAASGGALPSPAVRPRGRHVTAPVACARPNPPALGVRRAPEGVPPRTAPRRAAGHRAGRADTTSPSRSAAGGTATVTRRRPRDRGPSSAPPPATAPAGSPVHAGAVGRLLHNWSRPEADLRGFRIAGGGVV